jgi:hypothetical protein
MENTKPLKRLIKKVGYQKMADHFGVHLSTVYRWQYKEAGEPNGIRPSPANIIGLYELAKRHWISGVTVRYLVGL